MAATPWAAPSISSRSPPTNNLDASARFVAGNLGTFRTEARLSGPIVRDRILGSVAILRGVRDGFVRDLDHPDHSLGGEDVTAVRSKLHVVFNARSNLLVAGDMTHQDPIPLTYAKVLAVKPGFQVDNPADLHEVRASTLAEGRILQYGGTARFTAALRASTTLTSTTAFRKLEYNLVSDNDITELNLTAVHLQEAQHQWSEEVTISQQRPGLSWIAGLFLFNEVDRQPTLVTLMEPRHYNLLNPQVEAGNQAVFGQATIDLTSRVSVTAGLRYSREHKTIDNAGQLSTIDLPVTLVPGSAYSVHGCDLPYRLDSKVRPGVSRAGERVCLRLRDARLQERRVQLHVARGRPGLRARVGLEL